MATFIQQVVLSGALLAQLTHKVSVLCSGQLEKWIHWSDSMVKLARIKASPRITEISKHTTDRWIYFESKENPVGLISQGLMATEYQIVDDINT